MSIQASDSHFFPSFWNHPRQVAFGLMQSALLLTGLERSIQNTRALVGKKCWCFPDHPIARLGVKRIADLFFLIPPVLSVLSVSHFGVANDDTLTNSLAAVLQRLLKAS